MASLPFLALSLTLLVIWLVIFFFSKETRKEQLFMSVVGVVLTPGILFVALSDYRRSLPVSGAPIGIEDFLFAFALCGVAAVIYQVVFGRHLQKVRGQRFFVNPPHLHWISLVIMITGVWAAIALTLTTLFPINSVYAFAVGGLMVGTYIIADRHDLLLNALVSGAFVALLVFVLEQIFFTRLFPIDAGSVWQIENLSGTLLGSTPVEELLWVGVVGFAIGPLYEYVRGYRLK